VEGKTAVVEANGIETGDVMIDLLYELGPDIAESFSA
jgi:hypothetical protein